MLGQNSLINLWGLSLVGGVEKLTWVTVEKTVEHGDKNAWLWPPGVASVESALTKIRAALFMRQRCPKTNFKANSKLMKLRLYFPLTICSGNPFVCDIAGRLHSIACKKNCFEVCFPSMQRGRTYLVVCIRLPFGFTDDPRVMILQEIREAKTDLQFDFQSL